MPVGKLVSDDKMYYVIFHFWSNAWFSRGTNAASKWIEWVSIWRTRNIPGSLYTGSRAVE